MVDYLVVGLGLAGISFCHTLEQEKKSFHVISDNSQRSSWVAGGLYNPVILKRFKPAWKAAEQMIELKPFYTSLEKKLGVQLDYPVAVWRRFNSIEEQNMWFEASDQPVLSSFLNVDIKQNSNPKIHAPNGYGEVNGTGRLDTKALVNSYTAYLDKSKMITHERVDFEKLEISAEGVRYGSLRATKIVFATGFGMRYNPYFNYLPLQGTKGELLTIKAPELKETRVIKSSVFIIPMGEDHYRIGATYKWKDKTNDPTDEARTELLEKLNSFMNCEYELLDHIAGIRPTVTDRRPLVGRHPIHKNLYALNGFGSRGVMIAPYASARLFRYIENDEALPLEMDIDRFRKKYDGG